MSTRAQTLILDIVAVVEVVHASQASMLLQVQWAPK